jgi:hypothetical protein
MNREHVFLCRGLKEIEGKARDLVINTLAPVDSQISVVAVRVLNDETAPEDVFKYRCTILIRLIGGDIVRSEGRDCDEMLAIYEALSRAIDSLVQSTPAKSQRLLSGEFH